MRVARDLVEAIDQLITARTRFGDVMDVQDARNNLEQVIGEINEQTKSASGCGGNCPCKSSPPPFSSD
jgi:hypothetical protein